MKTSHTPGPWKQFRFLNQDEKTYGKGLYISNESETEVIAMIEPPAGINSENGKERAFSKEVVIANAKLIAAAPRLLQELYNTYVQLQTLVQQDLNKNSARLAIDTDGLRAAMRNAISEATGIDCETLQNEVESIARKTRNTLK